MMIFRRILSSILGLIVILASLYMIEAASYRLVEPYAKFRLNLSWGDYLDSEINPYLSKLPLDHFLQPVSSSHLLTSNEVLKREFYYSKKILGYLRPVRDRVANYFNNQTNPLATYDIRDLGLIKSAVLPGLFRPATMHDVNQGSARRIGDKIEYSNCLFIYLTHQKESNEIKKLFISLEKPFGFLASEGIASVLITASSKEALLAQINYLQSNYPNIANHIIIYGESDLASWPLLICQQTPGIVKACILQNPPADIPPPSANGSQWLLAVVDNDYKPSTTLNEWVIRSRSAQYFYPSRLGGLIYRKPVEMTEPLSSVVLSYALQCKDYIKEAEHHWIIDTLPNEPAGDPDPLKAELNSDQDNEAMYLCDAVRKYRILHENDSSIMALSNKQLILKIGKAMEALGPSAYAQLSKEDPEFVILYQSLK